MSTVTVTGTVTDQSGASGSYSVVVTLSSSAPLTLSAVVTPAIAPAGTTRTLAVTTTGGTGPFTFVKPTGTGLTFVPVVNQLGKWTFVL